MKTATRENILQAIDENRLRIKKNGICFFRLPYPKSTWRECTFEKVSAPKRKTFYHRLQFSMSEGRKRVLVHRAIWYVFRSDIPKGMTINHINGNKIDNRLNNLEMVTYSENIRHAIELGLNNVYSPKNWSLTENQVREIRHKVQTQTQKSLALEYNTNTNTICRIVNRKSYKSVM